jgi:hypothetical protein
MFKGMVSQSFSEFLNKEIFLQASYSQTLSKAWKDCFGKVYLWKLQML